MNKHLFFATIILFFYGPQSLNAQESFLLKCAVFENPQASQSSIVELNLPVSYAQYFEGKECKIIISKEDLEAIKRSPELILPFIDSEASAMSEEIVIDYSNLSKKGVLVLLGAAIAAIIPAGALGPLPAIIPSTALTAGTCICCGGAVCATGTCMLPSIGLGFLSVAGLFFYMLLNLNI